MNTMRRESLEIILEASYHKALVRREVGKFREHEKVHWNYEGCKGRDRVLGAAGSHVGLYRPK